MSLPIYMMLLYTQWGDLRVVLIPESLPEMAIMQEEHQLLLEVLTPARAGETQSGRQAALEAKAKTACYLETVELKVLQSRRHS